MRTFLAGTAGLLALVLAIFVMTGISNQAQGPPGGLDVRVINAPTEAVPVTGSLGVAGTADVNVVNTPMVEVANFPEAQPVEIVSGPQIAGGRFNFSIFDDPGGAVDHSVPGEVLLTDLVITVPPNARCLFTIFDGGLGVDNIMFRLGLGEASDSNIYELHLHSGLPGPLLLHFISAGVAGDFCSGQLFWRGFEVVNG